MNWTWPLYQTVGCCAHLIKISEEYNIEICEISYNKANSDQFISTNFMNVINTIVTTDHSCVDMSLAKKTCAGHVVFIWSRPWRPAFIDKIIEIHRVINKSNTTINPSTRKVEDANWNQQNVESKSSYILLLILNLTPRKILKRNIQKQSSFPLMYLPNGA